MKIGIIGVGAIGGTLARDFVTLGHDVAVANSRGPGSLAAFAAETGATAVAIADVVKGAQLVVVSIPEAAILKLPKDLFAHAEENVAIVDTGNYYPTVRDGELPGLADPDVVESQWVASQLGRPVLKAFNNIEAASLRDKGLPPGTAGRIALPVAGDSKDAKKLVMDLIEQIGFEAVDGGTLDESWRQQPGTPAYCHDLDLAAMKRALDDTRRDRLAWYRAEADARVQKMIAAAKAGPSA